MTVASLSLLLVGLFSASSATASTAEGYVGAAVCGSCHKAELALWRGSDHDRAIEQAGDKTVLGDFGGTSFTARGVQAIFSQRDDAFFVKTEGADGKAHEYPIAYTFGVDPLQQYLVTFPNGAYQALTTAWDTRPKKAGGQRWFDLHSEERTPAGDVLHWTGPANNWNRMCADCHSTNVQTSYVVAERRYETKWAEIDVACEACHGPGARHVEWGKARSSEASADGGDHGLVVDLAGSNAGAWVMSGESGIARLDEPRRSRAEIETCAPCHSRRSKIADHVPGGSFLDAYRPALLDEDLYFADGQILDEVYEWGSFVQSRMFHAGVTCGDCHEPHSLRLRAEGNAVCAKCHLPAKFDTPTHHHHTRASRAALCVECHMPSRTYMVIDARRDHSFRVPRPDLSAELGVPNACGNCHDGPNPPAPLPADGKGGVHGQDAPRWASEVIKKWKAAEPRPHFAPAITAGRRLGHGAGSKLIALIGDQTQPAIARATALGLLPSFAVEDVVSAVQRSTGDDEALVRAAAAGTGARLPPQIRPQLLQKLLDDRVRLVRLEAARALAATRSQLTGDRAAALDRGIEEYKASQLLNADQPQAHVNLGALYAELGMPEEAARAYQNAFEVGSYFIPAYVNLADLYRAGGEDDKAEATLRRGLEQAADDASLHHSLGLTMVRRGRSQEALAELRRAHQLDPEAARYAYVYGIALNSLGQRDAAVDVLRKAYDRHPADAEIAVALATIERDGGDAKAALRYARQIVAEWPNTQGLRRLVADLAQSSNLEP